MTKTAIVTTTINNRPESYKLWAAQGDLIVAGDLNTPATTASYVAELGGKFIMPEYEFPGSDYVPMRCVQRRNAAIWYALEHEYDYVVTIDDDNYPTSEHFVKLLTNEIGARPRNVISSHSRFINLGEICIPKFHQRGTPYGVDTRLTLNGVPDVPPMVVVAQAMVLGDPDCDAVERMANAPYVHAVQQRITVAPGTYAAFNSQATAWHRTWAPVMAVLPHIGRYDDIYASFIFHRMAREYNVALYAGDPVVKQERNEHNLINDLRAEMYGMHTTYQFTNALDLATISKLMPLHDAYAELIEAVAFLLPEQTVKFANEWAYAWRDDL